MEQSISNQFGKYVIPSIMSMVLVGMYSIIDSYFLCQAMGDDGLTAINLAWPLLAICLRVLNKKRERINHLSLF